jgi:ATP-dependent Lon protease
VMLPARNRKDFEDIPEETRQQLEFVWLEHVEEAVSAALEPATASNQQSAERPVRRLAEAGSG